MLFALLQAAPAADELPAPAQLPTPKGTSNSITIKDYPSAAIHERAQGNASVRYRIGTNGLVESCTVVSGSGNAALDEATCVIARRWRFNPARDAQGIKVPADQHLNIAWRMHDAGCKTDVPYGAICISPE
jgi:protein TonB